MPYGALCDALLMQSAGAFKTALEGVTSCHSFKPAAPLLGLRPEQATAHPMSSPCAKAN
eukprot:CAMPEP_0183554894 /NCGR_PEP_ID=MMETSP0371-20130417/79142_1 /TAXON_ID=268820 /ORGANISM="Peridinium aciculiferum, Strain PAER-2" /LENGTH=58 /DNA_ID=CAMNT_0025760939 /DNA_START=90 /DNA_END=266 /DNA_ORIENTATION=+